MIANDELKNYICNKYGYNCDDCSADMVAGCLDKYYKKDKMVVKDEN